MFDRVLATNCRTFRGLWTKGLDAPAGAPTGTNLHQPAPTRGGGEDRLPHPPSTASPLLIAGGYTRTYESSSADYAVV